MASRRRMVDTECWNAVGGTEARQSIANVGLFFVVHHSVISRLWKQFLTSQIVVRRPVAGHPRGSSVENRYIAVVAKRNRRAISICVARAGFR
ncbi:transposable element Tcb1 transposase [Caerostris darwini]|uniref:Transposable element Tcb1 transposase n=1 Tax=Caerostris darwini TaxID=1538125 RepID=A0AAV4SDH3_9ARAC|nr:transposable element Tcb1 transposase [Caerostris darwini]